MMITITDKSLVHFTFHDNDDEHSSTTTKTTTTTLVRLLFLSNKLREKFSSQQEGKLKWLIRRETIVHDLYYLPIEYANDEETIQKVFSKLVNNGYLITTTCSFGGVSPLEYLLPRIHPDLIRLGIREQLQCHIKNCQKETNSINSYANSKYQDIKKRVQDCGGLANIGEDLAIEYMQFIGKDGGVLRRLSKSLINDRSFVLKAVEICPVDIFAAPDHFQNDREIVITALRNDAWILENLEHAFQDDEDIFELVARTDLAALMFASERLRNDTSFIMKMFRKIAQDSSMDHMSEREIAMHMVKMNGLSLQFLNEEYRDDFEIVTCALNNHCHSLAYASERIRSDRDFMKKAIEKYSVVYSYASDDLRNNDVELALISIRGGNWIPVEHEMNRQVVKEAVKKSALQLTRVPDELKSCAPFMFEIINETTEPILKYITNELRFSQDFVLEAIRISSNNVLDLRNAEMDNKEFAKKVAQLTGYTCTYRNDLYEARMEYMFHGAKC
ncbi:hypothetical protein NAEGRDRAFT_59807 [Naegleria gruberi]|uniref:DUF4116 domain-containing protein n=1 Tax=Naegleria gruberi TaxID=5762 RepID=D2W107_NAEGR|nr:uncharacterized protein NAEGRDRAFT_59807 [Naegleria gruberi]EFC37274.1 hypothetical protein NAEGRDRAFT_59807 [Naegleria gruberi]|eukprot:XP_002670018.1 hypothetical protein NAEGRDRAFT_59807 [Naegleria gruberi strain NEG-M]